MRRINHSHDFEKRMEYLCDFKKRFELKDISEALDSLRNIRILCIGDTVIDKYVFVDPKGRALKDPILSTRFESEENYAGGVLAVANHLSSYVDRIKLVTLIGDQNPQSEFIEKSLSNNIETRFFVKDNSPTIVKERHLDFYRGNKLSKVEYMNDEPIPQKLSKEIMDYLSIELPNHDLIMLLDYDHGFMNDKIRRLIQEKSKFLSLNCQTNSANFGYNYVNRYKKADFITMNDLEMRLPLRMKFEETEEVISKFHKSFGYSRFLVTTGKSGCIFFNKGKEYSSPTLTDKIIDTIGAGDSVFALISPLVYSGLNDERVPFIANCVGGIDASIMGNKEYVDKSRLLNFIQEIYDEMG